MIEIPYDELELKIALIGIDLKKFNKKRIMKLKSEFKLAGLIPGGKKDLNKKIAEYHGISAKELINSTNYKVLREEYQKNLVNKFISKFVEKLDITKKQAWAILTAAMGLLDI